MTKLPTPEEAARAAETLYWLTHRPDVTNAVALLKAYAAGDLVRREDVRAELERLQAENEELKRKMKLLATERAAAADRAGYERGRAEVAKAYMDGQERAIKNNFVRETHAELAATQRRLAELEQELATWKQTAFDAGPREGTEEVVSKQRKWKFFLYRDTFLPGGSEADPEERVIETADPERTARELCKGAVQKVDWDPA